MAHFEVHVLNYNGAGFLERCLSSLQSVKTDNHYVHINVVDNGSTDNSKELVEREFPNVSFVALGKNLGFSEGNNQGSIRAAQRSRAEFGRTQDYDVFLNNDTEVTSDWLIEAAKVLEAEPDVGIVGSKALFMDRFISLGVKVTPPFIPSNMGSDDKRILGCFVNTPLDGFNIKKDPVRTRWVNAYPQESGGRWISPQSSILVPILDPDTNCKLFFSLRTIKEHAENVKIEFYLNNSITPFFVKESKGGENEEFEFEFSTSDYVSVIQNMGNFITPNWDAGDLGFGELNSSQIKAPYEVSAVCGVSLFIRHELFAKLKGFDPRYFAYFEDIDLSVRSYLAGYKCKIVPNSVLYHVHCGSSGGEWSPTFSRLVAFSHLLFTSKFATIPTWQARLEELKKASKDQFEIYLQRKDLNLTPQLRTYLSYLKMPHVFKYNRYKRKRFEMMLDNYPFSTKNSLKNPI